MRVITTQNGTTRPRRGYLDALARVQSFCLDIQQWVLQDPSWVRWSVPSPIRRGETAGMAKAAGRSAPRCINEYANVYEQRP
ncbi:hypothetical protein OG738_29095 [Amycolatopsis sp. NBC_01488]|uniref:hypothetical protein n=1 Tax=Amycolatopsis sp. NBC_01488 TaxID=2903563 RepID=UPI002E2BEED7|nr:hypothetical protein [Amycolatopsis sp. NBC_01488]